MKGRVGVATKYRTCLPHQRKLESLNFLSKEAKKRLKGIDSYLKHKNGRKTCRYCGISQTTFSKWLKGLKNRSKRPKTFRKSKVPLEHIFLITNLRKKYPSWSKYKLAVILKRDYGGVISPSTIGRILNKKGLIAERKTKKRRKAARRKVARKEAERYLKDLSPGALLYLDTKHLTFPAKTFYQFTAVDSKTRIKFIRVYSGASSKAGKLFLKELMKFMPFPISNIQTDNGAEFLKYFHQELERQNIPHYFSDANCVLNRTHR